MTQTPPPADLEAIQRRYDLANDTPSGATGEIMQEWRDRMDLELSSRAWDCVEDIPTLLAEIKRLEGDGGWRALVRQQIAELLAKDRLIERLERASAQDQETLDHVRGTVRELSAIIADRDRAFEQLGEQLRERSMERELVAHTHIQRLEAELTRLQNRITELSICLHPQLDADGFCESCGEPIV